MTEFDQMLNNCTVERATIVDGWTQGRATFGGLIAALMYRAVILSQPKKRSLRTLTINFVAPAASGDIQFSVEVLRVGKSVSQILCRAQQGEQVVAVMQVSLAEERNSEIYVAPPSAPSFKPAEQCVALPHAPGLTPEFTRHFDIRWAQGALPFCASAESVIGGWTRFKKDADGMDHDASASVEHILALIDVWPPAVLPMFKKPAPISSLSWTVEIITDPSGTHSRANTDWWQYHATTDTAEHGFAYIGAEFRNNADTLIALSRQTVMLFT